MAVEVVVEGLKKRYYNLKEICSYLGLKPNQVYWLVYKRKIPYHKLDKVRKSPLFFDIKEINMWMRDNCVVRYKDISRI